MQSFSFIFLYHQVCRSEAVISRFNSVKGFNSRLLDSTTEVNFFIQDLLLGLSSQLVRRSLFVTLCVMDSEVY